MVAGRARRRARQKVQLLGAASQRAAATGCSLAYCAPLLLRLRLSLRCRQGAGNRRSGASGATTARQVKACELAVAACPCDARFGARDAAGRAQVTCVGSVRV